MKNEQAKILHEDLSARLPYGVKIHIESCGEVWDDVLDSISIGKAGSTPMTYINRTVILENCICKPYLRPLSSMTQDEQDELHDWGFDYRCGKYGVSIESGRGLDMDNNISNYTMDYTDAIWLIRWFIKHHFDFNGLMEKGLALPAPKGMYEV